MIVESEPIDLISELIMDKIISEEIVFGEDVLNGPAQVNVQLLGQHSVLLPQFGVLELCVSEGGFHFVESACHDGYFSICVRFSCSLICLVWELSTMILSTCSRLYFFLSSISSFSLFSSSSSFWMVISLSWISLLSFSFLFRNYLFLTEKSSSWIFSSTIYSSSRWFYFTVFDSVFSI